jgi:hypothetical protein
MALDTTIATSSTRKWTDDIPLWIIALAVALVAELIGNVTVPIGPFKLVFFPILWGLIIGAVVSVMADRLKVPWLDRAAQMQCTALVQIVLMLFIAKLGLLVGAAIPKLISLGWALVFQEFGHFFGTILVALPIGIMLGIKREAIGATFSIGREPSLAIIAEKYGTASPEWRGVLAEYFTGSFIGTLFIGILASIITSVHLFDVRALAMGAGVGSGTLMAAAAGAIAAQQTPADAQVVGTLAAASNLITTIVGTYFTLFISLPVAVYLYRKLEPTLGKFSKPVVTADLETTGAIPKLGFGANLFALIGAGVIALITGNWLTYKTAPDSALGGMLIIIGVVVVGYGTYVLTNRKIPLVCWVSIIGMICTYPFGVVDKSIVAMTGKVNFLALGTPIQTFVGLSIAKDLTAFRRLGWRIVVTSLLANTGTFLLAALIAHFVLG